MFEDITQWNWDYDNERVWYINEKEDMEKAFLLSKTDHLWDILTSFYLSTAKHFAAGVLLGIEDYDTSKFKKFARLNDALWSATSFFIQDDLNALSKRFKFYDNELIGIGLVWIDQVQSILISNKDKYIEKFSDSDYYLILGKINALHNAVMKIQEKVEELRNIRAKLEAACADDSADKNFLF